MLFSFFSSALSSKLRSTLQGAVSLLVSRVSALPALQLVLRLGNRHDTRSFSRKLSQPESFLALSLSFTLVLSSDIFDYHVEDTLLGFWVAIV